MPADTSGASRAPDVAQSNRALLVAGPGIFMVFLDTQIPFVAFTDVRASFADVGTTTMSWVLSGYTLAFAALLVPAGRLADRWGRKSVFLWGLALLTIVPADEHGLWLADQPDRRRAPSHSAGGHGGAAVATA